MKITSKCSRSFSQATTLHTKLEAHTDIEYHLEIFYWLGHQYSPSHDDEEVQPVPGVSQVTATTKDPKSNHLYHHLQREEDVNECIKGLRGDKMEERERRQNIIYYNEENVLSAASLTLGGSSLAISFIFFIFQSLNEEHLAFSSQDKVSGFQK